ncbi:MAG: adenylate/guanylate cyclase domain-containing protein, partial [Alphaproteobacteria bacterium]|nr:adenylate/guanylate cyclase domain-containing protein [Alphaproteobacteria bacterium]
DEDEEKLQKSLLVISVVPFAFAGFAWGVMYYAFGEPLAGAIPFSYGIFSLLSICHFGLTRRYEFFRFSQLSLGLLLPFLLMLSLGGFVSGSAVILWSLVCPISAMLFDTPRNAPRWFLAFFGLIMLSGLLQPYLDATNNLSPQVVTFFFVNNLLGVGSMVFLLVWVFVGQKNAFQEKSETLLLNILPKEIAKILKDDQRTIADHYEGASVLFADVVDFTLMSATMTPDELVRLLNEVFSHFDLLAEKHGLEKIKTIGDCYMVAAGVPRPRADHAQVLARMALEMQDYVDRHEFQGRKLAFRIGLNSGPVVAGVIGRKKFIYDLWGEAVNTAARMESHGREGRIQITRDTYELIKDDFVCERRGLVEVKGTGDVETWFVAGAKTEPDQPAAVARSA